MKLSYFSAARDCAEVQLFFHCSLITQAPSPQTPMIIKPRTRGFICITAHPTGCAASIREQIEIVHSRERISDGPKNALIIGASTGYGLATRIVSAFACGSATIGVFMHRGSERGRTAEAGWYNSAAFERAAREEGLLAKSVNGDAFNNEVKQETIDLMQREFGKIDLLVYSLAGAPEN